MFEKQYQIISDPIKLQYYNLSLTDVMNSVKANNNNVGGGKLEMGGTGYIIRGLGYIKNQEDLENSATETEAVPSVIRTAAATKTKVVATSVASLCSNN